MSSDLLFATAVTYGNLALSAPNADAARLFHVCARAQWDAYLASL